MVFSWASFKKLKHAVNLLIFNAKKSYYCKLFDSTTSTVNIWNFCNLLLGRKKEKLHCITKLSANGVDYCTSENICITLANSFELKSESTASNLSLPVNDTEPPDWLLINNSEFLVAFKSFARKHSSDYAYKLVDGLYRNIK